MEVEPCMHFHNPLLMRTVQCSQQGDTSAMKPSAVTCCVMGMLAATTLQTCCRFEAVNLDDSGCLRPMRLLSSLQNLNLDIQSVYTGSKAVSAAVSGLTSLTCLALQIGCTICPDPTQMASRQVSWHAQRCRYGLLSCTTVIRQPAPNPVTLCSRLVKSSLCTTR